MYFKTLTFVIFSLFFVISGCGGKKQQTQPQELSAKIELDKTVGAFAEVFSPASIAVEGYGIVAGLNGKGSSECPPVLREYLLKYIQQMLGNANRFEAIRFLNSNNNAVVRVYGMIPAGASKNDRFDVAVEALASTQTISLNGGVLYATDMTAVSRVGVAGAKKLAIAQGPVYIDWCGSEGIDERKGRVLGGGVAFETGKMYLELKQPDYRLASILRARINERFGDKAAVAQSAEIIRLEPPQRYAGQYGKFASLVEALYLPQNDQSLNTRIEAMIEGIKAPQDTLGSEVGLEAIGKLALRQMRPLLNDENELIRLRGARCMLNIGYENAINVLMDIARDKNSQYRITAIEAIDGSRVEAKLLSPLRSLLNDDDFDVAYAAYTTLNKNNDMSILRQRTMAGFTLNTVITTGPRRIYITRERYPQILLFGNDIQIAKPVFVKDEPSGLTVNATDAGEKITLLRQNPVTPGVVGPMYCDFTIEDIIMKLTDNTSGITGRRIGMGLDYSAVTSVIKQLCDNGNISAKLHLGNMKELKRAMQPVQMPQETAPAAKETTK